MVKQNFQHNLKARVLGRKLPIYIIAIFSRSLKPLSAGFRTIDSYETEDSLISTSRFVLTRKARRLKGSGTFLEFSLSSESWFSIKTETVSICMCDLPWWLREILWWNEVGVFPRRWVSTLPWWGLVNVANSEGAGRNNWRTASQKMKTYQGNNERGSGGRGVQPEEEVDCQS